MSGKIHCSILTPDRTIFEGDVEFAVVQAHDGEMGFLADHAPLISELGIGEIRLREGKNAEYFVVEGGIVEIRDNKIIILAESAMKKEEINVEDINNRLKDLTGKEGELAQYSKDRILVQAEIKKYKARLKVASR